MTQMKLMALVVLGVFVLGMATTVALAQGIALYPGASASGMDSVEKSLKAQGYGSAVCRRSADSVEKVTAFYAKDKQLKPLGDGMTGFTGPGGNNLSIQNPWMDTATGKVNNDTLICIVNRKAG